MLRRITLLFLFLMFVGFGALAVDRYAPPQHLPWKAIELADPIGLATRVKIVRAGASPDACRAALYGGGVEYAEVAERGEGFCSVIDAVRLGEGTAARLTPANAAMTCRQALAVAVWERQVVQPAAEAILGQPVRRIEHYGTYACRRTYGREDTPVSQHASANALDVAAFRLGDGSTISVVRDWNDAGPKGRFLRQVRDGACEVFATTLSPDYNAAHRDHFHLDMGGWAKCG